MNTAEIIINAFLPIEIIDIFLALSEVLEELLAFRGACKFLRKFSFR